MDDAKTPIQWHFFLGCWSSRKPSYPQDEHFRGPLLRRQRPLLYQVSRLDMAVTV